MRRLAALACSRRSCWPAAAATARRPRARRAGRRQRRAPRRGAGRAGRPTARCGSRSSRTGRRRASSGRSSATASTPRRAGSTCSSTTGRPTSSASSAMSDADRPGRRDQARRARRLDPRARARAARSARAVKAGIPVVSINSGSDVFRRARRARPRRPGRGAARARGRPAARRRPGVRRALCVNQEVDNAGLDARCARLRDGDARGRRALARARRSTTRTRATPQPDRRAPSSRRRRRRARLNNSVGGLAAAEALARTGVKIGTFDLGPDVLKAVEAGRIDFAVDQQAYLQGYLPIEMLALRARYGIFPAQGDVVADRAELRHRRQRRAGRAAEPAGHPLTARGARRGRNPGMLGVLRQTAIYRAGVERPPPARAHRRHPARGARPQGDARRGVRLHRRRRRHRARPCAPTAPASTAGGSCRACCATSPSATPASSCSAAGSASPLLLAPGRRARDGRRRGRPRRRARRARRGRADDLLQPGLAPDGGVRARARRLAALVPAVLEHVERPRRELRRARRGVRLRGDRRHARHDDARLAHARPRPRLPAVPARQGDRAVHERPGVPADHRRGAARCSATTSSPSRRRPRCARSCS